MTVRKIFSGVVMFVLSFSGCGAFSGRKPAAEEDAVESVYPDSGIKKLEDGFSAVRYDGDYGFDLFLERGGADSDGAVIKFLAENLSGGLGLKSLTGGAFGCSTVTAADSDGNRIFGRNFDWNKCNAMVVAAYPDNGYASISTVNMDFITHGAGGLVSMLMKLSKVRTIAALYAPLDGFNEAGVSVAVNMIQDSAVISQNTGRPDITTTTAVRLLLDKAASTDEALELLRSYDMHASMGMMIHFAIADKSGHSVAVEYVDNRMIVTDSPVVTNFYLADGNKHGIGTAQSHERYEILVSALKSSPVMDMSQVRDALSSVSKGNFGEFESTEWSAVFNLSKGTARYYHRENYSKCYEFSLFNQF